MPTRSGGVFGFLSSLLGGQRTIAYRQPAPEPATPTVAPGEPEPKRKAVTVIVALDSQALADAVREQLGDQALADE